MQGRLSRSSGDGLGIGQALTIGERKSSVLGEPPKLGLRANAALIECSSGDGSTISINAADLIG